MTEKFTPGEWWADINTHEFCDTGDYVTDFGVVTGKNIGIAQCFDNSVINEEEAEANCYLIATAPEMYRNNEQTLTELEQMIPAMLSVCAVCQHRQCKDCQFAKVLKTASEMERRIEQVQKKARGEG